MAQNLKCSDLAVDVKTIVGESPVWDLESSTLSFVDLRGNRVYRYDVALQRCDVFPLPSMVRSIGLTDDHRYILALADSFLLLSPEDGGSTQHISDFVVDLRRVRFNDGKVDPWGRFVAGTADMSREGTDGNVFALYPNGSVKSLISGITLSNGLDWTPDRKHLVHVDSAHFGVSIFNVDPDSGDVLGRREFVAFDRGFGHPDGLTLDRDGCIWVAFFGGGCIRRFTPSGVLDTVVEVPVSHPTSVAFGGPSLEHLFITTARGPVPQENLVAQPHAGAVFVIEMAVGGLPPSRFPIHGRAAL